MNSGVQWLYPGETNHNHTLLGWQLVTSWEWVWLSLNTHASACVSVAGRLLLAFGWFSCPQNPHVFSWACAPSCPALGVKSARTVLCRLSMAVVIRAHTSVWLSIPGLPPDSLSQTAGGSLCSRMSSCSSVSGLLSSTSSSQYITFSFLSKSYIFLLGQLCHEAFSGHKMLKFNLLCIKLSGALIST